MPYIKQSRRLKYLPELIELSDKMQDAIEEEEGLPKGDLTYILYYLAIQYFQKTGISYSAISASISSLNDAAEEIRRRHLNPYEDKKAIENGDVLPSSCECTKTETGELFMCSKHLEWFQKAEEALRNKVSPGNLPSKEQLQALAVATKRVVMKELNKDE